MYVWVPTAGFVDAGDLIGREDADGDFLRDRSFASWARDAAEVDGFVGDVFGCDLLAHAILRGIGVSVTGLMAGPCAAFDTESSWCAAGTGEGCVGDDCQHEERLIVFLCEADGG